MVSKRRDIYIETVRPSAVIDSLKIERSLKIGPKIAGTIIYCCFSKGILRNCDVCLVLFGVTLIQLDEHSSKDCQLGV